MCTLIFITGLTSWVCPRWKIYAVQLKDIASSEEDNEINEPRSKKKIDRLDQLITTVNSIKH